ncbi:preprotein translocase subunit SecG [uncultured Microscilla sp.]|uniref:preprotein translocase subunit SecG n=1 Tax=uncultured Microscilla sp. TaxID=432653 RepID=UPI0026380CBB|nr:preprotein translocase subunit SecG [uncultured Microscilla sp.]
MYNIIIVLIIVVAVLLVLVVLAQNSKGGGLNSSFGGSSSPMIGVKKTGDLLEKVTWGFAVALFVLVLITKIPAISGKGGSSGDENPEGIEAGVPVNTPKKTTPSNKTTKPAEGTNKPADKK